MLISSTSTLRVLLSEQVSTSRSTKAIHDLPAGHTFPVSVPPRKRIEAHVEGFRTSADYGRWRELVGGFFGGPPKIEHTITLVEGL